MRTNGIVVLTAVLTSVFVYILGMYPFGSSPIAQWAQPKTIDYGSHDPYSVEVRFKGIDWHQIPPGREFEIFVGRASSSYGHYASFRFFPDWGEDVYQHIRSRSEVQWSAEGITFVSGSGHRLFIPKAMFIGGR